MKSTLLFFLAFVCLASCTSVDKLMERGLYAQAFQHSLSKLRGAKKKKTEYVKALEKSFAKLQEQTDREVTKLNAQDRPEHWPLVLSQYAEMDKRQQELDPLLPLVSETRYKAVFSFSDYAGAIRTAEEKTCQYYYDHALALIAKTQETGNRMHARQAYEEIGLIDKYRKAFKDADKVRDRARRAGTTLIYLDVQSDFIGIHGGGIAEELMTLPVSRLDNFWTDYSVDPRDKPSADYNVVVDLTGIYFSPERESINRYVESAEILVNKDKKQSKKDTVVVVTEKEVYEKVKAEVIEIQREKKAELSGRVIVTHTQTKEVLYSVPVTSITQFTGYCCRVEGDERALTEPSRKKLDSYCELFPTDFVMADALAEAFKKTVLAEVERMQLN